MRMNIVLILFSAILMAGASISLAQPSHVSTEVNEFVAKIYPKGSHYFWIINDAKAETQRELILDINTVLRDRIGEERGKGRVLLLLVDGKLFAAQRIPLDAEVECGKDKDEEV
jgi:hypothetical protein